MNTPAKLAIFVSGLAVTFGAAMGIGTLFPTSAAVSAAENPPTTAPPGDDGHSHPAPKAAAEVPGGLQISQDGYTLTPRTTELAPGEATDFRFTVTGPDGRPVTDYQVLHEKKMHFIVVRRDLSGFQHLHPELLDGGVWSIRLTLPEAGAYRAFADFAATGGEPLTLGMDLHAAGDYRSKPLAEVTRTAVVGEYTVALTGDLVPGKSGKLTLNVTRNGDPVTDLEPYLGAYGHLVALRAGDLAYLHVHPDGEPGDGKTAAGPGIVFHAQAPSPGAYRLYLDFKHAGTVRTAEFTLTAGGKADVKAPEQTTPDDGGEEHGGH
ncbi:hypothetical protein [Rhizohabitans arisaemae]|uniref:hypothetical protein n=1 Tax=Rhizohabitans arisaemae TaxID=2720610 RepID=UPI0024B11814|nr:hypothetical protein [Rhizohabitans arisaemae]